MTQIEFPQNKRKAALYACGAIGFSLIGVILITFNRDHAIMPYVVTLFFGYIGITGIKNSFKPDPYLIINDDGINLLTFTPGAILWTDINGARGAVSNGYQVIYLKLENASEYISRLNHITRLSYAIKSVFGSREFSLPLAYVKADPAEVLNIIIHEMKCRK